MRDTFTLSRPAAPPDPAGRDAQDRPAATPRTGRPRRQTRRDTQPKPPYLVESYNHHPPSTQVVRIGGALARP